MENGTGNGTSSDNKSEVYLCMTLFSVYSIVGICGNSLAVIVYSRKKDKLTSTIFILSLAIIDLTTCAVIIPMTMYMEYVDFMISSDVFCKTYQFLQTAGIPFSAFMMAAIAVDRYFCICHPFLHVFNDFRAKVVIAVLALVAFALGLIAGLMYGITEGLEVVENENVTTFQCGVSFEYFTFEALEVYKMVHLSTYFMSVAVVSVLYLLIYRRVITRRMQRSRQRAQRPRSDFSVSLRNEQSSVNEGVEMTTKVIISGSGKSDSMNGHGLDGENNVKEKAPEVDQTDTSPNLTLLSCNRNHVENKSPNNRKGSVSSKFTSIFKRSGSKNSVRERLMIANLKTAAMLFVVSVVFIVTFLPAMLVILGVIEFSASIFYLYFINNVANPVIYAFMNRNFRDDLKQLLLCQQKGRIVRYR